jgi:hypothetical protein
MAALDDLKAEVARNTALVQQLVSAGVVPGADVAAQTAALKANDDQIAALLPPPATP